MKSQSSNMIWWLPEPPIQAVLGPGLEGPGPSGGCTVEKVIRRKVMFCIGLPVGEITPETNTTAPLEAVPSPRAAPSIVRNFVAAVNAEKSAL